MKDQSVDIAYAIEVFVRGHSAGKSRTFPYEVSQVGPLWLMRDAPRRNPQDYRKEEWIAHGVDAVEVDAIVRRKTRGRFFICAVLRVGSPEGPLRSSYKALGYRLLATEGFYHHALGPVPMASAPVEIRRVQSVAEAEAFGKATRTRPLRQQMLSDDAPFRQYVALDKERIVGRVRSVDAAGATWCADMYVDQANRRRGIGRALLGRMLEDDRQRGSKGSYLTASHLGGMLYPKVGYEEIGKLFIFAPTRSDEGTALS